MESRADSIGSGRAIPIKQVRDFDAPALNTHLTREPGLSRSCSPSLGAAERGHLSSFFSSSASLFFQSRLFSSCFMAQCYQNKRTSAWRHLTHEPDEQIRQLRRRSGGLWCRRRGLGSDLSERVERCRRLGEEPTVSDRER